jgi:Fe2+ transport system protein FeoA
MKLSELPVGGKAVIRSFAPGESALARLREMGALPGAAVSVVRRAPLGDPIEIRVRGSLLSLRATEAALIEVEVVS